MSTIVGDCIHVLTSDRQRGGNGVGAVLSHSGHPRPGTDKIKNDIGTSDLVESCISHKSYTNIN